MFSMSLRLWAGSMSFSRLDQGNLFQQRAEGSEQPCQAVIRQRARPGNVRAAFRALLKGAAQQSAPRSGFSGRARPRSAPLPCPCPRCPGPAFHRNYRCAASRAHGHNALLRESPPGSSPGAWQEGTLLSPAPAGTASSTSRPARPVGSSGDGDEAGNPPVPVGTLLLLQGRAGRAGAGRAGGMAGLGLAGLGLARAAPEGTTRPVSTHIHPQQLLPARPCCARPCHARLCPAVPSRAWRREQSLSKASSPPCRAKHPLVCSTPQALHSP